jgi:pyruvate kinase
LQVVEPAAEGWWATCGQTAYVAPGVRLRLRRTGRDAMHRVAAATVVGDLPRRAQTLLLHRGETLVLTPDLQPGLPAERDERGRVLAPTRIGCTLPAIFSDVRPGERIWFDDGKIGGLIQAVQPEGIHIQITHAREAGSRLGADKGINLPDSRLTLPALTEQDLLTLPFIAAHAAMVDYSFVRSAADVSALQEQLAAAGGEHLGIIIKIETRAVIECLPEVLLAAMHSPAAGVMIARGDLAVECGYERLAELQEEILCLAEAAHLPVIWATQVLEQMAQEGIPSRAEISDAAMGVRAECVMLNKGPYIVAAVRALADILARMQGHRSKRSAMLRQLRLVRSFWPGAGEPATTRA